MNNEPLSDEAAEKLFEEAYNNAATGTRTEIPTEIEPTPEVEPEVPEVKEPEEGQPQPQDPVNDWLKDAPEEVRQRYVKELTDFNANRQRQAGLQRNMMEARQERDRLVRELEQLRGQKQPQQAFVPSTERIPEKWKQLTETDTDLALSIEERIQLAVEQAKREVEEKLTQVTNPLVTNQYEQHVHRELDLLKQVVPNYEEVVNHPQFIDWISHQSNELQDKYSHSVDHRDAVMIMKLYDYDLRQNGYVPSQNTPTAVTNPQADALAAQRAARVSTPTPQTRAPIAAPTRDPNAPLSDEEADRLFEQAYEAARKKRSPY